MDEPMLMGNDHDYGTEYEFNLLSEEVLEDQGLRLRQDVEGGQALDIRWIPENQWVDVDPQLELPVDQATIEVHMVDGMNTEVAWEDGVNSEVTVDQEESEEVTLDQGSILESMPILKSQVSSSTRMRRESIDSNVLAIDLNTFRRNKTNVNDYFKDSTVILTSPVNVEVNDTVHVISGFDLPSEAGDKKKKKKKKKRKKSRSKDADQRKKEESKAPKSNDRPPLKIRIPLNHPKPTKTLPTHAGETRTLSPGSKTMEDRPSVELKKSSSKKAKTAKPSLPAPEITSAKPSKSLNTLNSSVSKLFENPLLLVAKLSKPTGSTGKDVKEDGRPSVSKGTKPTMGKEIKKSKLSFQRSKDLKEKHLETAVDSSKNSGAKIPTTVESSSHVKPEAPNKQSTSKTLKRPGLPIHPENQGGKKRKFVPGHEDDEAKKKKQIKHIDSLIKNLKDLKKEVVSSDVSNSRSNPMLTSSLSVGATIVVKKEVGHREVRERIPRKPAFEEELSRKPGPNEIILKKKDAEGSVFRKIAPATGPPNLITGIMARMSTLKNTTPAPFK